MNDHLFIPQPVRMVLYLGSTVCTIEVVCEWKNEYPSGSAVPFQPNISFRITKSQGVWGGSKEPTPGKKLSNASGLFDKRRPETDDLS